MAVVAQPQQQRVEQGEPLGIASGRSPSSRELDERRAAPGSRGAGGARRRLAAEQVAGRPPTCQRTSSGGTPASSERARRVAPAVEIVRRGQVTDAHRSRPCSMRHTNSSSCSRLRRDQRRAGRRGRSSAAGRQSAAIDERPQLGDRHGQPRRHRRAAAGASARAARIRSTAFTPRPGHAQQHLARRAVDVDRKAVAMLAAPRRAWGRCRAQHARRRRPRRRSRRLESRRSASASRPGRAGARASAAGASAADRAGVRDRAEGRIIDPAQAEAVVERRARVRGCRASVAASAPTIIWVDWPAGREAGADL